MKAELPSLVDFLKSEEIGDLLGFAFLNKVKYLLNCLLLGFVIK